MKDHESVEDQGTLFEMPLAENVASLEVKRDEKTATPASIALQHVVEQHRIDAGLESPLSDDERDRRLDELADKLGSYDLARRQLGIDADETAPRRVAPEPRNTHRFPVHLRHDDEPSESDQFWMMTGDASSRTLEQRAINTQGNVVAKAVLDGIELSRISNLPTEKEQLEALRNFRIRAQKRSS